MVGLVVQLTTCVLPVWCVCMCGVCNIRRWMYVYGKWWYCLVNVLLFTSLNPCWQTEHSRFDGGRFVYRINRSPMCEYMVSFIHRLKHLPEKFMMNSVLENFTILQVRACEHSHLWSGYWSQWHPLSSLAQPQNCCNDRVCGTEKTSRYSELAFIYVTKMKGVYSYSNGVM